MVPGLDDFKLFGGKIARIFFDKRINQLRIFQELVNNLNDFIQKLDEFESLYPDEIAEITAALEHITLSTSFYGVMVKATIAGAQFPYQLDAVVSRQEGKTSVVYTREFML